MKSGLQIKWTSKDVHFLQANKAILRATLNASNLLEISGQPMTPSKNSIDLLSLFKTTPVTYTTIAFKTPIDGISQLRGHQILGHQGDEIMHKTSAAVTGLKLTNKPRPAYVPCKVANSTKKAHPRVRSFPQSNFPGELIHADIYSGHQKSPTMNDERYLVKFLDDATKYPGSYLLNYKTAEEALAAFKYFLSRIKHLYNNNTILNEISKLFRSDNDGAFMSVFHTILKKMASITNSFAINFVNFYNIHRKIFI
jgi:hypothetical protein